MNQHKNKIDELSILKGLAILCVVIGHSGSNLSNFVYLFHVCVFFIASGYTYKTPTTWKEYGTFIWKRFKRLYVPYVFYNLFFLAINNIFIECYIYPVEAYISKYFSHIIKIFLLIENAQIIGAAWFLRILFLLSVGYAFVDLILSKILCRVQVQGLIGFLFYTIGYFLWWKGLSANTYGMYFVILLTIYGFYYWGGVLQKIMPRLQKRCMIWILIGTFLILLLCNYIGSISMGKEYGFYGFFVIASFAGWFFLWSVSSFIISGSETLKMMKVVRKTLELFSKQSIYILLFHFIGFKLVTFGLILIYDDSLEKLKGFPISYNGWSMAYVIGGLAVSIILGWLISAIKLTVKKVIYK